jgi:hypothetical protein
VRDVLSATPAARTLNATHALVRSIDYMDEFKVFTTDPVAYPLQPFRTFVDSLHASNMVRRPATRAATSHALPRAGHRATSLSWTLA